MPYVDLGDHRPWVRVLRVLAPLDRRVQLCRGRNRQLGPTLVGTPTGERRPKPWRIRALSPKALARELVVHRAVAARDRGGSHGADAAVERISRPENSVRAAHHAREDDSEAPGRV